jgi:hypothetical protein
MGPSHNRRESRRLDVQFLSGIESSIADRREASGSLPALQVQISTRRHWHFAKHRNKETTLVHRRVLVGIRIFRLTLHEVVLAYA